MGRESSRRVHRHRKHRLLPSSVGLLGELDPGAAFGEVVAPVVEVFVYNRLAGGANGGEDVQ